MSSIKRYLDSTLIVAMAVAGLAAIGVMATPSGPAFAQTANCNAWSSGNECGWVEECTSWKLVGGSIGGSNTGGTIGLNWQCERKVRLMLKTWTASDGRSVPCTLCHGGGGSDPDSGEVDPWCEDPERAKLSPVYCDLQRWRQT